MKNIERLLNKLQALQDNLAKAEKSKHNSYTESNKLKKTAAEEKIRLLKNGQWTFEAEKVINGKLKKATDNFDYDAAAKEFRAQSGKQVEAPPEQKVAMPSAREASQIWGQHRQQPQPEMSPSQRAEQRLQTTINDAAEDNKRQQAVSKPASNKAVFIHTGSSHLPDESKDFGPVVEHRFNIYKPGQTNDDSNPEPIGQIGVKHYTDYDQDPYVLSDYDHGTMAALAGKYPDVIQHLLDHLNENADKFKEKALSLVPNRK